jgi:hypothetical protein
MAAGSTQMNDFDNNEYEDQVGYGNPPVSNRFKKGTSGNPKGRPKGSRSELPYETVLGQMVTVRQDGKERQVTAAEAFLLQLAKKGLDGDAIAARQSMEVIEGVHASQPADGEIRTTEFVITFVSVDSVDSALEPLRMAKKLDRFRDTARIMLEPWLVQAALARLGNRQLSHEEQKSVMQETRTPNKVNWPQWWDVEGQ